MTKDQTTNENGDSSQANNGTPVLELGLAKGVPVQQLSRAPNFGALGWRETMRTTGLSVEPELELDPEKVRKTYSLGHFFHEKHHSYYGMPWVMGKVYFDLLKIRGLMKNHKVLDAGCGAGRIGIHLIDYLDRGNYHGFDSHRPSLDAFSAYEVPLRDLQNKSPNIYEDYMFSVEGIGVKFDYILDFSTTIHIEENFRRDIYLKFRDALAPGGSIISAPGTILFQQPELKSLGFYHSHRRRLKVEGLEEFHRAKGKKRSEYTSWNEIQTRSS
ncbi:class I SAM-dependent methyltransferase [Parvularcula sp. IMCC14364]|uniref:class I SAM-dependent methyltransferase n=1 Tax=Parvularcula sp. IMCC14364 TaxID=3067902 RepID=UPI00274127EA|nr:class I SAM-dependent methyltransferase [Parvularcula sp. IMCC14364]